MREQLLEWAQSLPAPLAVFLPEVNRLGRAHDEWWHAYGSIVYAIVSFFGEHDLPVDFLYEKQVLAGALSVAMFPPVAVIGPLFNLWRTVGLFDTWPGLILPYMTFTLPLAIWILAAFFREIPWDLDKAARVDGATPLQACLYVIVPLAAPALAVLAIFSVMWRWNDFLWPLIVLSRNELFTLQVGLNSFQGDLQIQWHYVLAMTVLTLLPITVVFAFLERNITSGIATTGGVSGVATKYLARRDAKTHVLFGSGVQAKTQAWAVAP